MVLLSLSPGVVVSSPAAVVAGAVISSTSSSVLLDDVEVRRRGLRISMSLGTRTECDITTK